LIEWAAVAIELLTVTRPVDRIDSKELHLRTNRISSRVAPAASAARMWRRVASG
jgi:hypothetical protein